MIVNVDKLNVGKFTVWIIDFGKIVFIDGHLEFIVNALYYGFVGLKPLFFGIVPHEQFTSLCGSGIGWDVLPIVSLPWGVGHVC